jgi:hypothetical protein
VNVICLSPLIDYRANCRFQKVFRSNSTDRPDSRAALVENLFYLQGHWNVSVKRNERATRNCRKDGKLQTGMMLIFRQMPSCQQTCEVSRQILFRSESHVLPRGRVVTAFHGDARSIEPMASAKQHEVSTTVVTRIGQRLGNLPFGMNSQAGQNSHNSLRLAEGAPSDAVNRQDA